jgi:predicted dehydrogenase
VELTHDTLDEVLEGVECDAVACVDHYAQRGPTVIKALEAGKRALTDKPLCTEIGQLRQIARLSREKGLIVHVDLTMRYSAAASTFHRLVREGAIGELQAASVFGQHGLNWGSRPQWYFEQGKHGGTINDIMIHGIDMLRWVTGREFTRVIAASASAVADSPAPSFFQQSAQCYLEMDNSARMFGDASYLAPAGHHSPWRFYLWGSRGYLHFEGGALELQQAGKDPAPVEMADGPGVDPFEDFARQVEFGEQAFLGREECFRSTMATLTAQWAADSGQRDVEIEEI